MFVEADVSGLLHWGGASHAALRKAKWGEKYEAENRKLNPILSAYCFVKFINMGEANELGNKQELGKRALATIVLNDEKKDLFDPQLAALYSEVLKSVGGGWHAVAQKLRLQEQPAPLG